MTTNTTIDTSHKACKQCLTPKMCAMGRFCGKRLGPTAHKHRDRADHMACRDCYVIANGTETDSSSETRTPETTRPLAASTWRSSPSTSARSRIVVHEPPDPSASNASPASPSVPAMNALDRELARLKAEDAILKRKAERRKKKGVSEKLRGLFGEGQGW